ncbi:hypothetical protein SAMN05444398_11378 [Roseovarius pacificus]|uniref:Uncharacterized protein n=1 Tax=Roseovarius pacificus TaxID=337701 RepID=A0A1M7HS01_9RHOB|nr:hypothetical protein [Roseovarius pacificus]SHM31264.1 hypothetical protein SAMN05444398_11378 [Roseovarius pacificus]
MLVSVQSRDHALVKGPVPAGAFQAERRIYYIGDPTIGVERVGRVFSTDIWTVDDVEQIRRLMLAGAAANPRTSVGPG